MGTELQSRRDGGRSSVQEEGLDSARSIRGRGHQVWEQMLTDGLQGLRA